MLTEIAVVVPAHNEAAMLPLCLQSIRIAASAVLPVTVRVMVVADACSDSTAAVARSFGGDVLEGSYRNVGAARMAGFGRVLSAVSPDRLWLATTDADTVVPKHWFTGQFQHARTGVDLLAGTVDVADWSTWPDSLPMLYHGIYLNEWHHVHGANLAFRATAYVDSGGFRPVPTAEDALLVQAFRRRGHRVRYVGDLPVLTSARPDPRCRGGFGDYLRALAG